MDLRETKTKRSIRQAFLQLIDRKPIEKITVTELAELAEISKSTFYLHYKDIYDLLDALQNEFIQNILNSIEHPENAVKKPIVFINEILTAFHSKDKIINKLFFDIETAVLPIKLERQVKALVHKIMPETREDFTFNIMFSFQVFGCYCTYLDNYDKYGHDKIMDVVEELINALFNDINYDCLSKIDK